MFIILLTLLSCKVYASGYYNVFMHPQKPTIASIVPSSGSRHGGTMIYMIGTAFPHGMQVMIGGSPCLNVAIISGCTATCFTAAHSKGTVSLAVSNQVGQSVLVNSFKYK